MSSDFKLSLDDAKSSWSVALPSKAARSLPFFIEFIGDYYTLTGFYTKRDSVTNFMLMYTLSGQSHLEYDGESYTLNENSVFLVDCMKFHYYYPLTPTWHYKWIHIGGESIGFFYEMMYQHKPRVIYPKSPDHVDDIYIRLTELVKSPSVKNDLQINNLLTSLFTDIISDDSTFGSIKNSAYMEKCINFIANHYTETINIKELAASVFVSKYHLINLFNKSIGMPPYRYITEYRLNQSKFLLLNTDMMVSEIAERVGFNSESQYIKLFNQYIGITPKQFRKQYRQEAAT